MNTSRRSGFTLIEIMLVIIVATILSSITFGAFRSVSDGNKRTNCQSNLSQIYKSARLYAQDYNGKFPHLNAGGALTTQSATPGGGAGLWALYVYTVPIPSDPSLVLCTPNDFNDYNTDLNLPLASQDGSQLATYVRSAKIFHCPSDRFDKTVKLPPSAGCVERTVPTASLSIKEGNNTYLNPAFLSYQTRDDTGDTPRDTYSSFRASGQKRQLTYFTNTNGATDTPERPTDDKTVVTWCRFHRSLDSTGATVSGRRNYDNVLFADGTVQSIPHEQNIDDASVCTAAALPTPCTLVGWRRVPRSAGS